MSYLFLCKERLILLPIETKGKKFQHLQSTFMGLPGLPVYFIEPLHPAKFFWRGRFYSEPDDFKRFTYFCRAALEFLLQSGKRPDVIHSHDWHTAVVVIGLGLSAFPQLQ
jgi:glycogen synthase